MNDPKALPPETCEQLNALRKQLRVSQTELANRAGVAQGTASNCLNGKAVQQEILARLLTAFTAVIQEKVAAEQLTALAAEEHLRVVQKARSGSGLATMPAQLCAPPGGGMPPQAVNRIERAAWREMAAALDAHPVTMALEGPPQSGKSTLLLQFVQEARKRGFGVVYFDCSLVAVTTKQQQKTLFTSWAETLASEWGLELPGARPANAVAFTQWLASRRRRQPEPAGVIVVDQLHELVAEVAGELVGSVRVLHNQRGWLNLSFAVTQMAQSLAIDSWMQKSRGYFHPWIKISWFSKEEVEELVGRYPECSEPNQVAQWLMQEFKGQPFLTHVALSMYLKSGDMEAVLNAAHTFQGQFAVFRNGLDELDPETKEVLRSIYRESPPPLDHDQAEVRVLRKLHLIDANNHALSPTIPTAGLDSIPTREPGFYRLLIEHITRR